MVKGTKINGTTLMQAACFMQPTSWNLKIIECNCLSSVYRNGSDAAGTSRGDGSHPFTPGGCVRGCFSLPAEHWLHQGAAAELGQGTGCPNWSTMIASIQRTQTPNGRCVTMPLASPVVQTALDKLSSFNSQALPVGCSRKSEYNLIDWCSHFLHVQGPNSANIMVYGNRYAVKERRVT